MLLLHQLDYSMYEANFLIYEHRPVKRKITLATKKPQRNNWKIY